MWCKLVPEKRLYEVFWIIKEEFVVDLRFASVCSGIGAPDLAFERLGWEPVFQSEIEKFPSAVLATRECERLQGFPDNFTRIPWRGKSADDCPDGNRYKALGNSWAVPCGAWIGSRIAAALRGE